MAAVTVTCPRESGASGSIPLPDISHSKTCENRVTLNVPPNLSQLVEVPMMAILLDFLLVSHLSSCPMSTLLSGANTATILCWNLNFV